MAQSKSKKNTTPWLQCEKCTTNILTKDIEKHSRDCPPTGAGTPTCGYNYIKDEILHGSLDNKYNEEVKGVTDNASLVFVSQAVIQLCGLSIGEWAQLRPLNSIPMAKIVWPTTEKTLTSVLLTKLALELCSCEVNTPVIVSKLDEEDVLEASKIIVVLLNKPMAMEVGPDLSTRLSKYLHDKIYSPGNTISLLYFGKVLKILIKSITGRPSLEKAFKNSLKLQESGDGNQIKFYRVTSKTNIEVFSSQEEIERLSEEENLMSTIGGLDEVMSEIKEALSLALSEKSQTFGLKNAKSVVLYGNQGTGKTLLATAISQESGVNFIKISPSDLYKDSTTTPEDILKSSFKEAEEHAPTVVLLDEIDVLAPSKNLGRTSDSDRRLASTLLTLLDNLSPRKQVFLIATTNKIDSLDSGLRRPGRLDLEIEIPTPNSKARRKILSKLLEKVTHDLSDGDLDEISLNTHGFVGADLSSLASRAGALAQRGNALKVSLKDFKEAQKFVRPSAMKEVQVEVSNVKWSDIGGQNRLKLILKQAVEWPLRHPQSFTRLGITPPRGVLMYGPPGCSKTMIAKALATESGLNFLSIKGPELFSKWVGESEKAVRDVFRKARQVAPSIIFFDEIDALGGERGGGSGGGSTNVQERVLAQLLTELDGVSPLGDVTVLAATNRPDRIDKALLRPGRLDRIVYVPLPDVETRRDIFKIKLSKMPVCDLHLEELVQSTEGYSGAEINAVCHEAAMLALEEDLEASNVKNDHFTQALKLITPRTPQSLIDLYRNYSNNS